MTEPIHCPCCNSVDTVSYWDVQNKKPARPGALKSVEYIYRAHWPHRRICVDCEAQWNPHLRDLSLRDRISALVTRGHISAEDAKHDLENAFGELYATAVDAKLVYGDTDDGALDAR